jgi:hypothetical protein
VEAVCTNAFGDNAWLFIETAGANTIDPLPYVKPGSTDPVAVGDTDRAGSPMGGRQIIQDAAPVEHENPPATQVQANYPQIWSGAIRIYNAGVGDLEYSFDGTNVHGYIAANQSEIFPNRFEAGICVRGVSGATPTVHIEAW